MASRTSNQRRPDGHLDGKVNALILRHTRFTSSNPIPYLDRAHAETLGGV